MRKRKLQSFIHDYLFIVTVSLCFCLLFRHTEYSEILCFGNCWAKKMGCRNEWQQLNKCSVDVRITVFSVFALTSWLVWLPSLVLIGGVLL